ncbi:Jouberin [Drechslerella dactyloides]|uniref:Jouberin n=1 Tax=Drechslerella dactyloides TaxID=74499 RepID=A0AAD6NI78_DREDA|nr:Jouberin [Drechslerella dactyloides]
MGSPHHTPAVGPEDPTDDQPSFISNTDALEEIIPDDDQPMDDISDDEEASAGVESSSTAYRGEGAGESIEIDLVNDSIAHFDAHTDSIYSIALNPRMPVVATGGGDDVAYIWPSTPANAPASRGQERSGQTPIFKVEGHGESVTAVAFTASGEFLVAGSMNGKVSVTRCTNAADPLAAASWKTIAEVQEVDEISWLVAHPSADAFALGAADGSVWVYGIDAAAVGAELVIKQALYNHTASCTAGVFAKDGTLLATVSEDSRLFVHNVETGEVVASFGPEDARFNVDGGLYAVAANPAGTVIVVGGATGECKVVALPTAGTATGGRSAGARGRGSATAGTQSAQILATLSTQSESIESLTFSPTLPLLASASVDKSIVLYDTQRWTVRRTITGHEDSVVKVQFGAGQQDGWVLTSCSMDGTVRRWDCRTGEEKVKWQGHADGVLGFVLDSTRVITAGDE